MQEGPTQPLFSPFFFHSTNVARDDELSFNVGVHYLQSIRLLSSCSYYFRSFFFFLLIHILFLPPIFVMEKGILGHNLLIFAFFFPGGLKTIGRASYFHNVSVPGLGSGSGE